MSYRDGWAAIRLEMPPRVPRTEYSAEGHYALMSRVNGWPVDEHSDEAEKGRARRAFLSAWNYDFLWNTCIGAEAVEQRRTRMGHATYVAGGADFSVDIACPFPDVESVLAFDPERFYDVPPHAQIRRRFEEHYRNACENYADAVNMTGIYVSCMSGLIDMFGWDRMLSALGEDPERFGRVVESYGRFIGRYFEALADADVPMVMIHDDLVWTSGPFAHPAWYRKYIFPTLKRNLAPVRESGKRIAFTSDGDYTAFIDDIADCGVHGFVLEPMTNMAYIAQRYGRTHFFVGNVDTRALLLGTRADIRAEVQRCMDIGKGCPGFFLAVGNHIPANTPVENALYYEECYRELGRR